MKRRDVIGLLGGAAAAWPFASLAQGERPRRIGYLSGLPQGESGASIVALKTSLEALGWSEGRNLIIDYRWAGDQIERIPDFAKEIIDLEPDGLLAHGTPAVAALQAETKAIPIVFVVVSDPVGSGFVASLPRPGGNITGFINLEASLGGKWVELLKDILPDIKRAVLIFNPDTAPSSATTVTPSTPRRARSGSSRSCKWFAPAPTSNRPLPISRAGMPASS